MTPTKPRFRLPPIPVRQGVQQVLALWTLAVAQPIYRALGTEIEFFLAHHTGPLDLAIFVLFLGFLLPLTLALALTALRPLSTSLYAVANIGVCAGLAGVFGLQVTKAMEAPAGLDLLLSAAATLATAAGIIYSQQFRKFLGVLSFSALICPVLFFNTGRVSQVAMGVLNADPMLPQVSATTPVVFVIFDQFPQYAVLNEQGEIDGERFPNLAALAGQSTWYRYASATCDDTTLSVPAILSGIFPDPRKKPLISDHSNNLFTLLGASYQMKVEEYVTRLAPRGSGQTLTESLPDRLHLLAEDTVIYFGHIALPKRIASAWLPSVEFSWAGFAKAGNSKEARASDFERFIEEIQPSDKPILYFKHTMLPHYPYVYLPSGQEYDNSGAAACDGLEEHAWRSEWGAHVGFQRLTLQAVYVDKLIGELVAHLKETGFYDRCLLVITSDHGASFHGGSPHRLTTPDNVAEQLFVPLLIKEPNQKEGRVSLANVTSLDILPTVADILGVSLPWETGGRSLRGLPLAANPEDTQREKVFLAHLHAVKPALFRLSDWQTRYAKTVAWAGRQFPEPGVTGLYKIGPNVQELYGKPLGQLKIEQPAPFAAELPASALLTNVDPNAPYLPVRLKGTVPASALPTRDPIPMAVALHGQIASLTYIQPDGSFETILDPALLKPGDNSVQLFMVENDTLRPIAEHQRQSYRLEPGQVVDGGGQVFPFRTADTLLTSWVLEGNRVILRGYAVPPNGQKVARLLVFRDDQYVCEWPLKPEEAARFERDLPRDLLDDKLPHLVVLFSDGSATELAKRDSYALRSAVMTSSGGQAPLQR